MNHIASLHSRLLSIDTHIDIPWPKGPEFFEPGPRRVDLPKLRKGNVSAGCFAAYVPQGPRTDEGHEAAYARAIGMLQAIRAMGAETRESPSRVCVTADEIERAKAGGVTAIIPCVENGHACGADPVRIRHFRALGARYLTITHNGHNALADSSNPRADLGDAAEEHGGLSPLGREAIAELNRQGMLVDIAHVSKATMMQAAELSSTPVLSTHSCIKAVCDNPRNVDDEQLDMLRQVGGVVHITAVPHFLRSGKKSGDVTLDDFVDHVEYAVKRIGIEHVGISSDFDGGGGFRGWQDASESAHVTDALLRRGYDEAAIALLWSGNFMRVLRIAEAKAD